MTTDTGLLVVVAGPTAVGKTSLSVSLARHFKSEILSADSRQFYREMRIGTAVPQKEELAEVPHHFIHHLSIHDPYDVSKYETDALILLEHLFQRHRVLFLVGGSGLYINAVCNGIDILPDPDPELRRQLKEVLAKKGIKSLQEEVLMQDPHFPPSDFHNPIRLIRAIEIFKSTGLPASAVRTKSNRQRRFKIVKLGLELPRAQLYSRINQRVDEMIRSGLSEEVKSLQSYRSLNALNTVGYKELFDYFDGTISFETAVEKIKTHSRRYAKRQLTWFKKDPQFSWYNPERSDLLIDRIAQEL